MQSDHPDLIDVDRRLQRRFDAVLDAEREAAAVAARRATGLRDRLIELEDLDVTVTVSTSGGHHFRGGRLSVGADHVGVDGPSSRVVIPIDAIEAVSW